MKIVILFGGNLGDSKSYFKRAIASFSKLGYSLENTSSLYRSAAWGYTSNNTYLNQVVIFNKSEKPLKILSDALQIEKELGRVRKDDGSYHDRPIDIDILYLDDIILNDENLELPHPRLHLRRFTLLPLVEILANFIHPVLKKDHKSLVDLCPDTNEVEKID